MIEAMKQALEALENTTPTGFNMERDKQFYAAITSLRQAIADAEKQEPVAWSTEVKHGKLFFHIGNQSFPIDYTPENETEIAWMENQLHHALSKLASLPQLQQEPDDDLTIAYMAGVHDGSKTPKEK